jgi:hypothetical protein
MDKQLFDAGWEFTDQVGTFPAQGLGACYLAARCLDFEATRS